MKDSFTQFFLQRDLVHIADDALKCLELSGMLECTDASTYHQLPKALTPLLQSKNADARKSASNMLAKAISFATTRLSNYFGGWCSNILVNMQRECDDEEFDGMLGLAVVIFRASRTRADLSRDITGEYAPNLVNLLIKPGLADPARRKQKLVFLAEMTRLYPSIMRPFAEKVMNGCIKIMWEAEESEFVAVKEALLVTVNCAGKGGCDEKLLILYQKLIGTANVMLDTLFDQVDEETFYRPPFSAFNVPNLSSDYFQSTPVLVKRLLRLLDVLASGLKHSYVGSVKIPLFELLILVQRISNCADSFVKKTDAIVEKFEFTRLFLEQLQLGVCQLLSTCFLALGGSVMRYRKMVTTCLRALVEFSVGKKLLETKVLSSIVTILRASDFSFSETFNEALFKFSLRFLYPDPFAAETTESAETGKKGKKRTYDIANSHSDALCDEKRLILALKVLTELVLKGISIKSRKNLDQALVSHLLRVKCSATSVYSSAIKSRYGAAVREELYNCLLVSAQTSSYTDQTILPVALQLFSNGLNDPDSNVTRVCKFAMISLDKLVHPVGGSLDFSQTKNFIEEKQSDDDEEQKSEPESKKQKVEDISERKDAEASVITLASVESASAEPEIKEVSAEVEPTKHVKSVALELVVANSSPEAPAVEVHPNYEAEIEKIEPIEQFSQLTQDETFQEDLEFELIDEDPDE